MDHNQPNITITTSSNIELEIIIGNNYYCNIDGEIFYGRLTKYDQNINGAILMSHNDVSVVCLDELYLK